MHFVSNNLGINEVCKFGYEKGRSAPEMSAALTLLKKGASDATAMLREHLGGKNRDTKNRGHQRGREREPSLVQHGDEALDDRSVPEVEAAEVGLARSRADLAVLEMGSW